MILPMSQTHPFRHSNTARNWYGECKGNLQGKMRVLKYHLYIQNKHYRKYNEIKTKMKKKRNLTIYWLFWKLPNTQENEIQSAYFSQNNFSIVTACSYVRITELKTLDKCSVAIATEASNQSRIVMILKIIHSLILKVMN